MFPAFPFSPGRPERRHGRFCGEEKGQLQRPVRAVAFAPSRYLKEKCGHPVLGANKSSFKGPRSDAGFGGAGRGLAGGDREISATQLLAEVPPRSLRCVSVST